MIFFIFPENIKIIITDIKTIVGMAKTINLNLFSSGKSIIIRLRIEIKQNVSSPITLSKIIVVLMLANE